MGKAKRKSEDDDARGGAGAAPSMHAGPALTLEDARALIEIARRGGATIYVAQPATVALTQVIRMRQAGLIDTQLEIIGRPRLRLTPAGAMRLVDAAKLIAATPGAAL